MKRYYRKSSRLLVKHKKLGKTQEFKKSFLPSSGITNNVGQIETSFFGRRFRRGRSNGYPRRAKNNDGIYVRVKLVTPIPEVVAGQGYPDEDRSTTQASFVVNRRNRLPL